MNDDEYNSICEYFRFSCWTPFKCKVGYIETCLLYRDWNTPLICQVRNDWPSTIKICFLITRKVIEGQLSIVDSNNILKYVFDNCNYRIPIWERIVNDTLWLKKNKSIRLQIYLQCKKMIINDEYNSKLMKIAGHFPDLILSQAWKDCNRITLNKDKKYLSDFIEVSSDIIIHHKHRCNNVKCKWLNGKVHIISLTNKETNYIESVHKAIDFKEKNIVFTIPIGLLASFLESCKTAGNMKWQ